MSFLKKSFKLGDIVLPSNVFCAPLAGYSNYPFRKILSMFRPGLMFCEMVKMEALVRQNKATMQMLEYDESMRPIGAQICGSDLSIAAESAKMIEDMGFDVLDLNCGCPVPKVVKDGSGSGLLKNHMLIPEIISKMVSAVKIPVTVKIRSGWDQNNIVAVEITKLVEKAGARAICIHGRTRSQLYSGESDKTIIKACKMEAKDILVVGNGGVFDTASAESMFLETGCDAIMIARGTLGTPWLVEDILNDFTTTKKEDDYIKSMFIKHIEELVAFLGPDKALNLLRGLGSWYFRGRRGFRSIRDAIAKSKNIDTIFQAL